jgi:hypothetical protein
LIVPPYCGSFAAFGVVVVVVVVGVVVVVVVVVVVDVIGCDTVPFTSVGAVVVLEAGAHDPRINTPTIKQLTINNTVLTFFTFSSLTLFPRLVPNPVTMKLPPIY